MSTYGRTHARGTEARNKLKKAAAKKDDKPNTPLEKLRAKPGMSNAYSYSKNNIFAGPHGTYPLTRDSKKIDPRRVLAAWRLRGHAADPEKIKRNILSILEKKHAMPTLAARLRKSINKAA